MANAEITLAILHDKIWTNLTRQYNTSKMLHSIGDKEEKV